MTKTTAAEREASEIFFYYDAFYTEVGSMPKITEATAFVSGVIQDVIDEECKLLVEALQRIAGEPNYDYPSDQYPELDGFLEGQEVGWAEALSEQAKVARVALAEFEKGKP